MWQIKKFSKYDKSLNLIAVLAVMVFLILAAFVPSVKVFFILAFGFFAFLVLYYSFPKGIIYSSFPLGFIGLAQVHQILVVPAKAITSNQYWEGKHLAYAISPYLLISVIALILIFFWQKKLNYQAKVLNFETTIIILFGFAFLSSIYASLIPSLSIFTVFYQIATLSWAWYLSRTLSYSTIKEQQKIIASLFLIICTIISFETLIVFKQTFSQSPVGLAIEATKFAPSFGLGADEGGGGFRPFGLQSHPNGLANNQLILAFSAWILFAHLDKKRNKFFNRTIWLVLSFSAINIVLSLSRAAFIAILFASIFLLSRHKDDFIKFKNNLKVIVSKMSIRNSITFALILFYLIFKFTGRSLNSLYSFSENGGVNTRIIQYSEALAVFVKSPLLGIGDRMFIPTSFQLFPKGVMTYFPEDVHNGILLFTIERGLLGLLVYLIFLVQLHIKIKYSSINKQAKSVIYSGLIAGFTMMLFHPEKNFLSSFVLLVAALINFNYEKRKNNKT